MSFICINNKKKSFAEFIKASKAAGNAIASMTKPGDVVAVGKATSFEQIEAYLGAMLYKRIPAIIPQNLSIVREKFSTLQGLVKKVAIDIVDGKYAPVTTWPFNEDQSDEFLKIIRGEEKFPYIDDFILQIDMLTLHPIEYISDLISLGAKSFVIHIDSTDHIKECVQTIKSANCELGLGIRPSIDAELLEPYLPQIDFVQFMGNDRIGYNGVELDHLVIEKIKKFHKVHPSIQIQVDIGVNFETAPLLVQAGASSLISGSAIFNSADLKQAITRLQNS